MAYWGTRRFPLWGGPQNEKSKLFANFRPKWINSLQLLDIFELPNLHVQKRKAPVDSSDFLSLIGLLCLNKGVYLKSKDISYTNLCPKLNSNQENWCSVKKF